ncbi:MAG: DNA repair protein RecO [Candidatus Spechtbacterales bacterium]
MYTTDAIILSSRPSGEADELISCYTKDFGKLAIKVKGAKKITTKQGNFLHSFALVRLSFVLGRGGAICSGVTDIENYPHTNRDLYATGYVAAFLALCDTVCYDNQPDEALWQLLTKVLREAEEASSGNAQDKNALLWHKEKIWLISLLDVWGIKPPHLSIEHATNKRQLDHYLQTLLQRKLERPISFFGLKVTPA